MAGIKTHKTDDSVDDYLASIVDERRRADCIVLLDLMKRATGQEPALWSAGMIGFGTYHYRSSSGQEGDWCPVGFANRKAALTVYLGLDVNDFAEQLGRLGTHTTGKGCIYIKRLEQVDLQVLEDLVSTAYSRMMREYS